MFRTITRKMGVATLVVILGSGLTANAVANENDSGFLKDYSQLQSEKDALGAERRMWVSPKFTQANYQQALVEPISFYPAPQPSEQVSMGVLNDIRTYSDGQLRKAFAAVVPLATAPGPGVMRLRMALTAVAVEGFKLKPYELRPPGTPTQTHR